MKRDDDDVIEVSGELPQFPDDDYDAIVLAAKKVCSFGGRWVAHFRFQILTAGVAFQKIVDAYVGLGPTGRTVSPHGKLASWMRIVSDFTGGADGPGHPSRLSGLLVQSPD